MDEKQQEEVENDVGVFNIELLNLKRGLHTLTHLDDASRKFIHHPLKKHWKKILSNIEVFRIQMGPKLGEDSEIIRSKLEELKTRSNNNWENDDTFNTDIINFVEYINKSAYDNGILAAGTGEIEHITL